MSDEQNAEEKHSKSS